MIRWTAIATVIVLVMSMHELSRRTTKPPMRGFALVSAASAVLIFVFLVVAWAT